MEHSNSLIRIGRINYTNVWPIYYYFDVGSLGKQVELILQVPTELNKGMALGKIDMGPISSFAYAKSHKDYVLFPDLSVSAYGKVNSIFLFHKKPISELRFGKIALPTTSATSVNLLKILMAKLFDGAPEYFYASPSLKDMMKEADAALLIGDDAIKANLQGTSYEVTDLGALWTSYTGQWMPFAVWAVREETVSRYPELVEKIFTAFQQSKQKGLAHPDEMIQTARANIGGSYDHWHEYFSNLCYDFGELQAKGLKLYFQYAYELGLIDFEVPIKIWSKTKTI